MTQLKTKLAASSQKASVSGSSSSTAQRVAAEEPGKETHAQDIISTLLAGPMAKMSIGGTGSGSTGASSKTSAPSTVLYAHPSVSGQYPLVIEDEYLSDSMDEASDEDVGAPRAGSASNNHHQFHYNYGTSPPLAAMAVAVARDAGMDEEMDAGMDEEMDAGVAAKGLQADSAAGLAANPSSPGAATPGLETPSDSAPMTKNQEKNEAKRKAKMEKFLKKQAAQNKAGSAETNTNKGRKPREKETKAEASKPKE
ncbi:hypothetical protein GGI22_007244, partial [Coemansia erecta]